MRKISIPNRPFLKLILLSVSAVTAVILPGKSNDLKQHVNSADNGTLISNSGFTPGLGGIKSCVTEYNDLLFSCHLTADNITFTGVFSEFIGNRTAGNTSNSNPLNSHDTTSIVS